MPKGRPTCTALGCVQRRRFSVLNRSSTMVLLELGAGSFGSGRCHQSYGNMALRNGADRPVSLYPKQNMLSFGSGEIRFKVA